MSKNDGAGTNTPKLIVRSPLMAAIEAVLYGRGDAVKDAGKPKPMAIPGVDEDTGVVSTLKLQIPKTPLPKFKVTMPPPDGRKMPTSDDVAAATLAAMDKGGLQGMLDTLQTFFFEGKRDKMAPQLKVWLDKVLAVQGNLEGLPDEDRALRRGPEYLKELADLIKAFDKKLFLPPLHRFPRKQKPDGEIVPLTADEMSMLKERVGEINADKAKQIGLLHEHGVQVLEAVVETGKLLKAEYGVTGKAVNELVNPAKRKGGR